MQHVAKGAQSETYLLRDFQTKLVGEVYQAWADGAQNVMMISPTGSGKGKMIGHVIRDLDVPSVVIAHRQEILSQLALSLNAENVPHAIIAPKTVVKQIVSLEMAVHGYAQYNARARTHVAAVNTLAARDPAPWYPSVQLVIVDEAHHVQKENVWGRALELFSNARGLFPTAHAIRGDGGGLGRHSDGVVDSIVVGPSGRALIDSGLLVDYRIFCPPSDIHLENVHVGASGEFNQKEIRAAVHASPRIVGDVVRSYLKIAPGKLGITFCVDIESATDIAREYSASGIPAEIITGETPLNIRAALMAQFRERRILQLVAVDVLSEGVDVPAVEVVSMARPTHSFQTYAQQFGRALRLSVSPFLNEIWNNLTPDERKRHIAESSKPRAIIIDHVQNVLRHGLPDVEREYTLDRRDSKSRGRPADAIPLHTCLKCLQPYEKILTECPYCGEPWVPANRSTPDAVDGDLIELDPEVLAALRSEVARIDGPARIPKGVPPGAVIRNHLDRQAAQSTLRRVMALWGGYQEQTTGSLRVAQKYFHTRFGVDILTAQTLNAVDAAALTARIEIEIQKLNIVEAVA